MSPSPPPTSTLFPYTTLFRSPRRRDAPESCRALRAGGPGRQLVLHHGADRRGHVPRVPAPERSEEHTSELQSRGHLVCRLLLEKKNTTNYFLCTPTMSRKHRI